MTDAKHAPHDLDGRRLTVRRMAAMAAALAAVSGLVFLLGADYLWPLFIFPLFLGAVFFFELGSLAVTFWLGNFFVLYYSFRAPATAGVVRQALLGMVLLREPVLPARIAAACLVLAGVVLVRLR